jgi:hypothetical protein
MRRKLIWASVLLVSLPQTSFAYVDPGTGAYVVQALVALIGAGVFYITHPRELIRKLRTRLRGRKQQP